MLTHSKDPVYLNPKHIIWMTTSGPLILDQSMRHTYRIHVGLTGMTGEWPLYYTSEKTRDEDFTALQKLCTDDLLGT